VKKTKLNKIPILVQLYPEDVYKSDLAKALKIDRHNLTNELLKQPALYGFWAGLYSIVSARVAFLIEQLENLEGELFKYYRIDKHISKPTDIKHFIQRNPKHQEARKKLRRWQDAERTLKYAERAFSQRKDILMAINANRRADKKSEGYREED
jgi:hypothetical protein